MISVYVAGASHELDRVMRMVARLERTGLVKLAHPWWEAVASNGPGNDSAYSASEKLSHAMADLQAVRESDVLWCLLPECRSLGAPTELGYALARQEVFAKPRHIIVSGPAVGGYIFSTLLMAAFSDELALTHVLRLAAPQEKT